MFEWFGKTISTPLTEAPQDADHYITPSATLEPDQRIRIYQEQYWWRLLKCLQKNFPSLTRLLGYERFNEEIAVPYLTDNPPSHWSLSRLGEMLPATLTGDQKILAQIDWAANIAVWQKGHPPLTQAQDKVGVQPYVSLFALDADYFAYRENFKTLEKRPCYFVVYRKPKVAYHELEKGAYELLIRLRETQSVSQACLGTPEKFVSLWFATFAKLGLLC